MRRVTVVLLALVVCLALHGVAVGQETGHYVSGFEGVKAGSLPVPGLYWRLYNSYYRAGGLRNQMGHKVSVGFDYDVYRMVNRLVWITDQKLLGADYGLDVWLPFVYTDVEALSTGVTDSEAGVGDIYLAPASLSWHGQLWDASASLGVYIPTGDSDAPASPGRDFWTGMLSLGGTYYLDIDRTLSVSILGRYETHGEKDEGNVTLGDDFHFEWGIGKKLEKACELGVAGYCHWQVSDDSGSDVTWDRGGHDSVLAAGPEIIFSVPQIQSSLSLRGQWELEAEDRTEGYIVTVTLAKKVL